MEKDCGASLEVIRVDGGMVENDLLMQFQADILNRPVVKSSINETTSLGAAYAAGLAVGFFKNTEDLCKKWSAARSWSPNLDRKSTRLNSSHTVISYAVFCLKKKKHKKKHKYN